MSCWWRNWRGATRKQLEQANGTPALSWSGRQHNAAFAVAQGANLNDAAFRQSRGIPPPLWKRALTDFGNGDRV